MQVYRETARYTLAYAAITPRNGAGANQSNESYTRDLRACNL